MYEITCLFHEQNEICVIQTAQQLHIKEYGLNGNRKMLLKVEKN